jgi:23S rRNA (adenine2503-C2)-methyltransferase
MNKPDIRHINFEQLQDWVIAQGLPKYRAQQIYDWLWLKNVASYDEMTDIPKTLRQQLAEHFDIKNIQTQSIQISKDKTIKCAIRLFDNAVVESVLIPTSYLR